MDKSGGIISRATASAGGRHTAEAADAVAQEIIDLVAVLNAVRTALPFGEMTDF